MMDWRKKYYPLIVVAAVCLLMLINNYFWLMIDRCPFTYDAHRHFMLSLRVFEEYKQLSLSSLSKILALAQRHPPFVGMSTAPFYYIFGTGQDTGTMINCAIFLPCLFFPVYFIARELKGPACGVLAVFITATTPIIFNSMKTYNLDLPLTSMVALSAWLLVLSRNFTRPVCSLLFALSFGIGFLVKDSFPVYIGVPLLVSLFSGIPGVLRRRELQEGRIRNFLVSLAVMVLICSVYVFVKHDLLLEKLRFSEYMTFFFPHERISTLPGWFYALSKRLKSIVWYLWGFINWQVSFLYLISFAIGGAVFLRQRYPFKKIVLSGLSGFLLVALLKGAYGEHMIWMGVRFTMPVLPFVAIISAVGISSIARRWVKTVLLVVIIIFGLIQFWAVNYGMKSLPRKIAINLKDFVPKREFPSFFQEEIIIFSQSWPAYGGPLSFPNAEMPEKIEVPERIFAAIDSDSFPRSASILVIPDISRIWAALEYDSYKLSRPYAVLGDWTYALAGYNSNVRGFPCRGENKFEDMIGELILSSDYVVDKNAGELGEQYLINTVLKLSAEFGKYKDRFMLLECFVWPDGTKIYLYKRR